MKSVPVMFSTVSGLSITALGAGLASSGLVGWGLSAVGLGILGMSLLPLLTQRTRPLAIAADNAARPYPPSRH